MKPKIFSEITGNTHGIRFKIKPPIKPKKRKVTIPREGWAACAAAIAGVANCQAVRSLPFGNFEKTINPGIADKFLAGDSIGIRKVISFPCGIGCLDDQQRCCPEAADKNQWSDNSPSRRLRF